MELSTQQPKTSDASLRLRVKGQGTTWHHLFKSDLQRMLKNESFRKGQPKIVQLEHSHVFHNVNSQLKPQVDSSTVGGHFHKIRYEIIDGIPTVVECGPPLTYKYVTRAGGVQRRVCVQVGWDDATGDDVKRVQDSHTHTFTYIHSEELTERRARNVSNEDILQREMQDVGMQDLD